MPLCLSVTYLLEINVTVVVYINDTINCHFCNFLKCSLAVSTLYDVFLKNFPKIFFKISTFLSSSYDDCKSMKFLRYSQDVF